MNSYKKDGKEKKVEFTADHNLRKEAYLELTVNSTDICPLKESLHGKK